MRRVNQVVTATITALFLCGVPAAQAWTTENTEKHWAARADKAKRITTAPRSMRADAEAGEEMLEAFGTKYLPNAYALYRAKREKAKRKEAIFKDEFPNGRRPSSTEREFYDKVVKSVAKAVAEMDRRHDELCYYYLLHKIGAVTDAELAKIDSSPIAIMLFQEGEPKDVGTYKEIKEEQRVFAEKFLPTVLADYDFLVKAFVEGKAVYVTGVKMDAGNAGLVLRPIAERLDEIRQKIDALAGTMRQQRAYYALEETTAEQLAELDRKMGREIQRFKESPSLRNYVRSRLNALNNRKKVLDQGYRPSLRNQIVPSEGQWCVSLISDAIRKEWDKESFSWHAGLRPIEMKLRLGAGGVVRGFSIKSGSGDESVDRTAQNALARLKGRSIPGLTSEFIKQYPELDLYMEPTKGR